jgi:hypothetical protein
MTAILENNVWAIKKGKFNITLGQAVPNDSIAW